MRNIVNYWKKLFLFIAIASLNNSSVFAQDCISQQASALRNNESNRASCKSLLANNRNQWIQCMYETSVKFSEESCVPATKASAKVVGFLWQQYAFIRSDLRAGRLNVNEYMQKESSIFDLIEKEELDGANQLRGIINDASRQIAQQRAEQNMLSAISILGGVMQRSSGPKI
jgi:hypothetical protein